MKKLIPCLGLAVALAISANGYGVLVDSFEDGDLGPWHVETGGAVLSIDPNDGSDGTHSVLVTRDFGGWKQDLSMDPAPVAAIESNTIVFWDVKVDPNDFTEFVETLAIINSELGGFEQGPEITTIMDNEWHTYSWDYSALKPDLVGSVWVHMNFVGNSNNGPNPFKYRFDNVRLGPETGLPGDFDDNGVVDGDDYIFWQLDAGT